MKHRLAVGTAIVVASLLVALAHAQYLTPSQDLTSYAKKTDVPSPSGSVPPADMLGGAIGSAPTYTRGDSARPRNSRAVMAAVAGGSGNASGNWPTAFVSTTPIPIAALVLNAATGTNKINCEWVTISQTGYSVNCKTTLLTINILGLGNLTFWNNVANGTSVYVTAIEPSQ